MLIEDVLWVTDVCRYSESRSDVENQTVSRVLSWHGPHLSRRDEFCHAEYRRRCESFSLSEHLPLQLTYLVLYRYLMLCI